MLVRKTAILIDGGFFHKKISKLVTFSNDPKRLAELMCSIARQHVGESRELYRIFYYDCLPYDKKHHLPVSKKAIDYQKSEIYKFKMLFMEELKRQRSVAIRLGHLKEREPRALFQLKSDATKQLLTKEISVDALTDENFKVDLIQKGVDMRIGLDIASLTYKKLVDQIVLFAGDSDFVPAAKLARREGIDFVLDPLRSTIAPDLFEHIDGLKTTIRKKKTTSSEPKSE